MERIVGAVAGDAACLPARTRLALILVVSALLHVALLSRLPRTPIPSLPSILDISLEVDVTPVTPRLRPRASDAPPAPASEEQAKERPRSILDATRDYFRAEMERKRAHGGVAPDSFQLPELPALGDRYRQPEGLVHSDRLAGGGVRYVYRDRNGKTTIWECPEPSFDDGFALNLCRTGY